MSSSPTKQSLISALNRTPAPDRSSALRLLEALSNGSDLSAAELGGLRLPDGSGRLRPLSELFIRDIVSPEWMPSKRFAIDPEVPKTLCLKVPLLSDLLAASNTGDVGAVGDQMPEDIERRISDALRGYRSDAALNEVVAHACDAGASVVEMLMDDRQFGVERLLCEGAAICQDPALVFCHNATLSESDFNGLLRVGQDGWGSGGRSLGPFGFRALSYFYFTEVSIPITDHAQIDRLFAGRYDLVG